MLQVPKDTRPFTIIGIDPGTSSLGVCTITWDMKDQKFHVRDARTLSGGGTQHSYNALQDQHGERIVRLQLLHDQLVEYLRDQRAHAVASESPFMGRFAAAFKALSECLYMIRLAVSTFSTTVPFQTVSPIEAKRAAGVEFGKKKKGMKKDDIQRAIRKNPQLVWHVDIDTLDEHSVDAVAVALFYLQQEAQS